MGYKQQDECVCSLVQKRVVVMVRLKVLWEEVSVEFARAQKNGSMCDSR